MAARHAKEKLAESAPAFAALGDPTRLRIVARLCAEGPLSIVRLTDGADVSRQAVSKHLAALEQAGLVRSERAGRSRIWALRAERIAQVRRHLERIAADWDRALERLRDFVEKDGR